MLWFWIFMTIITLIIPLMMVIFGSVFIKSAPKKINSLYGYRTNRSMKNQRTWEFAHKALGKIWLITGVILAVLSVVLMIFAFDFDIDKLSVYTIIIEAAETVIMLISALFVEAQLKKKFDKNGEEIV